MATLTRRKIWVRTIFQGDDVGELAQLARLAERTGDSQRLDDQETDAQATYRAAIERAAERAIEVWVTHIGRKAYRSLLTEHPPRDDNEIDQQLGWNDETFPDALLMASVVTDPAVDDLEDFLDALSEDDAELVFTAAVATNGGGSADPRLRLYSDTTPSTDATSGSPDRLG